MHLGRIGKLYNYISLNEINREKNNEMIYHFRNGTQRNFSRYSDYGVYEKLSPHIIMNRNRGKGMNCLFSANAENNYSIEYDESNKKCDNSKKNNSGIQKNNSDKIRKWLKSIDMKDVDNIKFFEEGTRENLKDLKSPKKEILINCIKNGYL
jgi:hypothetical protein